MYVGVFAYLVIFFLVLAVLIYLTIVRKKQVITAPMSTVNAIAVEAYKKYILVSLIHNGQVCKVKSLEFPALKFECHQNLVIHSASTIHCKFVIITVPMQSESYNHIIYMMQITMRFMTYIGTREVTNCNRFQCLYRNVAQMHWLEWPAYMLQSI